jgi:hypothetical protein
MGKRLGDEDSAAVDLLLDRANTAQSGDSGAFATPAGDAAVKRIGAVEAVFRLLAEMPAAEPPADLVQKTMQRTHQQENLAPGTSSQHPQPPALGQEHA